MKNIKGYWIISILTAALLLFAVPLIAPAQASTGIEVQTSSAAGAPGEEFTLTIGINGAVDLWGAQVNIKFDPNILEAVVDPNDPLLTNGNIFVGGSSKVMKNEDYADNVSGVIRYAVNFKNVTGVTPFTGSGTLASVTMRVKEGASLGPQSIAFEEIPQLVPNGAILTVVSGGTTTILPGEQFSRTNGTYTVTYDPTVGSVTASATGMVNTTLDYNGQSYSGKKIPGTSVTLGGTYILRGGATIDTGDAGVYLFVNSVPTGDPSTWNLAGATKLQGAEVGSGTFSKTLTLTANQVNTVVVLVKDSAGRYGTYPTGGGTPVLIYPDTTAPTGSISINSGATKTGSAGVSLTITDAPSDTATMKIANTEAGLSGAQTAAFSAGPLDWTLSAGDGTKTVYIQLIDDVGNISSTISDTISLVTSASSGSVGINSGAAYTNQATVTLQITPDDPANVTDMMVSNDPSFTGGAWEAYSATKSWTLAAGDGSKTVHVKFKNELGQESAVASDSITLDTAGPVIALSPNISDNQIFTADFDLTITVTDSFDGSPSKAVTLDGTPQSGNTISFSTEKTYTLNITATDAAGNQSTRNVTFELNKQVPQINISGVTDGQFYRQPVTPTVNVTQGLFSSATLSKDGGPAEAYTPGTTISADGQYVLQINADNSVNGLTNSLDVTFTIDQQAPSFVADSFTPKDNPATTGVNESVVTTRRPSLAFSVADAGPSGIDPNGFVLAVVANTGGTQYSLTGVSYDANTGIVSGQPAVDLPDGAYHLEASIADKAGNTVQCDQSFGQFTVDLTAPVITISGVGAALTNQDVTVSISVSDVIDGSPQVSISLNGTPWTPVTITAEGQYTLSVTATDWVGNVSTQSATFEIDKTAPTLGALSVSPAAPNGQNGWYTTTPAVTITSPDSDTASISYQVGSGQVQTVSGNSAQPVLADGDYTLTYWAIDSAGNQSAPETRAFMIDTSLSSLSYGLSPAQPDGSGGWYKTQPTLTLTGSDANFASITYQIGSSPAQTVSSAVYAVTLPDSIGSGYTVTAYVTDMAGNQSQAVTLNTLKVDSTAPVVGPVSLNKTMLKAGDRLEVTAVVGQQDSISSVIFDLGTYKKNIPMTSTGSGVYTGYFTVADGINLTNTAVTVKFRDQAGNIGTGNAPQTVTISTVKPTAAVTVNTAPGASGWYRTTPQATIKTNGTRIIYNLDGGANTTVESGTAAVSMPEGTHTLNFYAEDSFGNSSDPGSMIFKVDTTAPAAPGIDSPASGTTTGSRQVSVTGTVNEPGVTVYLKVNGAVRASQASQGTFTFSDVEIKEGTNTLEVFAKDQAGNTGSGTTITVTRDTLSPVIEVLVNDTGDVTINSSEPLSGIPAVTFNGNAVTDIVQAGLKSYTSVVELVYGDNEIVATGSDPTGNSGTGRWKKVIANAGEPVSAGDVTLTFEQSTFNRDTVGIIVRSEVINEDPGYTVLIPPMNFVFEDNGAELQPSVGNAVYLTINIPNAQAMGITQQSDLNKITLLYWDGDSWEGPQGAIASRTLNPDGTATVVASVNQFSSYTVGADLTPPSLTGIAAVITATGEEIANPLPDGTGITINGTTEAGVTVRAKLGSNVLNTDSPSGTGFTLNINTVSLAEGANTVTIEASDAAGNTTTSEINVIKDSIEPELQTLGDGTTRNNTAQITATASDANGIVSITVSGPGITTQESAVSPAVFTVTLQQEGQNQFTVTATDIAGNTRQQNVTITRSSSSPVITMDSYPSTTTKSIVTISGSTDGDQVTVTVGGLPAAVTMDVGAESNTFSANVTLAQGINNITVTASYSEGGSSEQDITIVRNEPRLGNLNANGGTLSPAFAAGTTSYTVSVENGVSSIIFTAAPEDSNSTMTLNGQALASGEAKSVSLNVGVNTVVIVVNAQDGNTVKTYTITVTRASATITGGGVGGGGGGGGGGFVTVVPTTTTGFSLAEVARQLSEGRSEVTYQAPANASDVSISKEIIDKLAEAASNLVVKTSDVIFKLPPETLLAAAGTGDLKLSARAVNEYEASELKQKMVGLKAVGHIYDLSAGGVESFVKPVEVTLSYSGASLTAEEISSLGVRYYNETSQQWVSVASTVNAAEKNVRFLTSHFSKWTLVVAQQPPQLGKTFTDTAGHWAAAFISQLTGKGVISGYLDGTFKPDNNITRAEFSVIIVKALGLSPDNNHPLSFTDRDQIPGWARGYIAAAVKAGIIKGNEDGTFRPGNNVTRAEIAVMVARSLGGQAVENPALRFADAGSVPDWAAGYIAYAYDKGIITGYTDGTFRPGGKATRAEASVMVVKMLNLK